MNRRQFLSSVAGLGVSAALPAIPKSTLGPPCYPEIVDIPFNLLPGAVNYVETRYSVPQYMWQILNAGQPLDSRREPWQAGDAGDVPVQE